jgi:hypothetical protein
MYQLKRRINSESTIQLHQALAILKLPIRQHQEILDTYQLNQHQEILVTYQLNKHQEILDSYQLNQFKHQVKHQERHLVRHQVNLEPSQSEQLNLDTDQSTLSAFPQKRSKATL